MNLLLEGDDLEALLLRAHREGGATARIVRAEKIRRGGVLGFFAKEGFQVAVEIPTTPQPGEEEQQQAWTGQSMSMEPLASSESVTPTQPLVPAQSLTPAQPLTPAQSLTPAQPLTPTQPLTPAQSLAPAESVTSTKPATPIEAPTPAEASDPAEYRTTIIPAGYRGSNDYSTSTASTLLDLVERADAARKAAALAKIRDAAYEAVMRETKEEPDEAEELAAARQAAYAAVMRDTMVQPPEPDEPDDDPDERDEPDQPSFRPDAFQNDVSIGVLAAVAAELVIGAKPFIPSVFAEARLVPPTPPTPAVLPIPKSRATTENQPDFEPQIAPADQAAPTDQATPESQANPDNQTNPDNQASAAERAIPESGATPADQAISMKIGPTAAPALAEADAGAGADADADDPVVAEEQAAPELPVRLSLVPDPGSSPAADDSVTACAPTQSTPAKGRQWPGRSGVSGPLTPIWPIRRPTKPAKFPEPAKLLEPAEPIKPAEPAEPAEPTEPAEPAEPTEIAETAEPTEARITAEPFRTTEPSRGKPSPGVNQTTVPIISLGNGRGVGPAPSSRSSSSSSPPDSVRPHPTAKAKTPRGAHAKTPTIGATHGAYEPVRLVKPAESAQPITAADLELSMSGGLPPDAAGTPRATTVVPRRKTRWAAGANHALPTQRSATPEPGDPKLDSDHTDTGAASCSEPSELDRPAGPARSGDPDAVVPPVTTILDAGSYAVTPAADPLGATTADGITTSATATPDRITTGAVSTDSTSIEPEAMDWISATEQTPDEPASTPRTSNDAAWRLMRGWRPGARRRSTSGTDTVHWQHARELEAEDWTPEDIEPVLAPEQASIAFSQAATHGAVPAGSALIETVDQLAADREALRLLGVPAAWTERLTAGDRFTSIVTMLGQLAEPKVPDDAAVIAVVGPADVVELEAHRTALDLPSSGRPRAVTLLPGQTGIDRRSAIARSKRVRPVVVSIPIDGYDDPAGTRKLLDNVNAEAVIVVIDASRPLKEITRWIEALERVDAIVLGGALDVASPAAVLGLNVPVIRVDGIAVDRIGWAALLCAQLPAMESPR